MPDQTQSGQLFHFIAHPHRLPDPDAPERAR